MSEQPRQEFDLRYPARLQPDGGPCWCMSTDEPHKRWQHSPLCNEMFRRWWRDDEGARFGPHPGEHHDFDMTCTSCGMRGMLNVAFITSDEYVEVKPIPDWRTPSAEPSEAGS